MKLETADIWNEYYPEVFFFILKRVKCRDAANEIIQNSFVKIHRKLHTLRQVSRKRAWVFQIARNEIINFYHQQKKTRVSPGLEPGVWDRRGQFEGLCCFDRFVNELPGKYKSVIFLVYFEGKKFSQVAEELKISLANVKARARRGKNMLKERFRECCQFNMDVNGKLVGESNCSVCDPV